MDETDQEDRHWALLVRLARLRYIEGLMQTEIVERLKSEPDLGLNPSKCSRLLREVEDKKLVHHEIVVPKQQELEERMHKASGRAIRKIVVVPNGIAKSGKNIRNIAPATARVVIDALRIIDKDRITIAMSCGETLRAISDFLVERFESDEALREHFSKKVLKIVPTTLWPDDNISAEFHHSLVSALAIRLRKEVDDSARIEAIASALPKNFYELSSKERKEFRSRYLVDDTLDDIRCADVFVIGLGLTTDPTYKRLAREIGVSMSETEEKKYPAEVCYVPVSREGKPRANVETIIVGLSVSELREAARYPKRFVIAHAGGVKREKVNGLLNDPVCNVLVCDMGVARGYLAQATPRVAAGSEIM